MERLEVYHAFWYDEKVKAMRYLTLRPRKGDDVQALAAEWVKKASPHFTPEKVVIRADSQLRSMLGLDAGNTLPLCPICG